MNDSRQTVLIIAGDAHARGALESLLSLHGLLAIGAPGAQEGIDRLTHTDIDLLVLDMDTAHSLGPAVDASGLFHVLRARFPLVPVILLAAGPHLETAATLVKAGAADYAGKPWDESRLLASLRNLLLLRRVSVRLESVDHERRQARAHLASHFNLCGAVYESDQMHSIVQMATQVARTEVPILIVGPHGSGKQLIAEIIHANSSVQRGPFVRVNASALTPDIVAAAQGGTLYLKDVGNLPVGGQEALLDILQTGKARVRIVSAANTDLRAAIACGRFREDLYHSINVIELGVPPLARRPADVLPLARAFLGASHRLDTGAESALKAHSWPGNVRELKNAVRRACLLSPGCVISAQSLELARMSAGDTDAAADPDRRDIERALNKTGGIVARAARELGLSRQSLYRRMDRFGIRVGA